MPVQHRNNVNFVNMTVINTSNATLCYISAYVSHDIPSTIRVTPSPIRLKSAMGE